MKAVKIYPSSPISCPNGFKKLATYVSRFISPINIFDISHITIPAGAATAKALPSTNMVLSNIDLVITLIICGFLYGGNSKTKDEASPFSIVFERIFEMPKLIAIPNKITPKTARVDTNEEYWFATRLPINIEDIVISIGNLPLHGTKQFVSIAIIFSLVEFIILHPIIPAALHPNPIHIVSACFPVVPAFLNTLSILNAILGKYPKSSNNTNNGKNIAIGGSITEITQDAVLNIPATNTPLTQLGTLNFVQYSISLLSIPCEKI